MASADRRRRAGSTGAGESHTPDPETKDGQPAADDTKPVKRTPEEVVRIIRPDFLEFFIERNGKPATLRVPTQFTMGDIVKRKVYEDFDAYYRLVMIEVGNISSINLAANPTLVFANENIEYLALAMTTSNTLEFMKRILSKSAFVVDEDGKEFPCSNADIDQLTTTEKVTIGGMYVGRWLENWIKAQNAKNPERAAQT